MLEIKCLGCGNVIEYDAADVEVRMWGYEMIYEILCPCCNHYIIVGGN